MYSIYTILHASLTSANSLSTAPGALSFLGSDHLLELARRCGFVVRCPRKLDLRAFVFSSMLVALEGCWSLRQQAFVVGLAADVTLSKQGLHKRMTRRAGAFLQQCLGAALAWRIPATERPAVAGFPRILIQDSTCLSLPAALAHFFPGPSNQSGKPQASLRIQGLYDLVGERFLQFLLCPFTRNDQAAALDAIPWLRPGDLLLRDLGYFTLNSLRAIASKGAFFLSRLHSGVTLLDPLSGHPLDLAKILPSERPLELPVLLGQEEKIPLRLLAFPLPESLANARRRKARANRDKRLRPSPRYFHLLGWNLLLTNACPGQLPLQKAPALYRLRWRIEVLFKAWKSHLGLRSPSRIGPHQAEILVYGLLLAVVLLHRCLQNPPSGRSPLSVLLLAHFLAFFLLPMALSPPDLGHFPRRLLSQLSFHCRYEKRLRPNYLNLLDSLS